ncbi:MAG: sulfotransferase [Myxococcota bacterium]
MQDKLFFLIGPPRSGSTLLARMLGTHSAVHAPAEPHLLTPLAHLGYYASVESAPYDPIISRGAIRELVGELPGGEASYLEALRAYSDAIYSPLLEASGKRLLLDKTPAYALVLDFLAKLYPRSRYVVLTRHPLAIWSSQVQSFFDGDYQAAHRLNPLLERYVPAMARFLRERPVPLHHVRYEELVKDPGTQLEGLCEFLGLEFEPQMVNYGGAPQGLAKAAAGLGDPISVAQETRPTTKFLERWSDEMAGDPDRVAYAHRILETLLDEDLAAWGFSRGEIEAQLDAVDGAAPRRPRRLSRYTAQRKLLVVLRRNIHRNAFGRLVQRVRFACDVLLR